MPVNWMWLSVLWAGGNRGKHSFLSSVDIWLCLLLAVLMCISLYRFMMWFIFDTHDHCHYTISGLLAGKRSPLLQAQDHTCWAFSPFYYLLHHVIPTHCLFHTSLHSHREATLHLLSGQLQLWEDLIFFHQLVQRWICLFIWNFSTDGLFCKFNNSCMSLRSKHIWLIFYPNTKMCMKLTLHCLSVFVK